MADYFTVYDSLHYARQINITQRRLKAAKSDMIQAWLLVALQTNIERYKASKYTEMLLSMNTY